MSSTIIAIGLVLILSAVHVRIHRHAAWASSSRARFRILLGYTFTAFSAYWITSASLMWEWALAGAWALAAAAALLTGSSTLRRVAVDQAAVALAMETIEPATGAVPR